jgi:ribosomal protein S18 acetylase RimI-like enzyme
VLSYAELYRRGIDTVLASWAEYARGVPGAGLLRLRGVTAAVFPDEPERSVYNNAILEQAHGIAAMEEAYASAGIERFAAWVHEGDEALARELERRGYVLDTTTRAMGMELDGTLPPRPQLDLSTPPWEEYLRTFDLPAGLLEHADRGALMVRVARLDGQDASTALAFDHDGDCGLYNVGTVEHARRRGLGTAVTALHLHDAAARGCRTASLQATEMAERMYAGVGFRDLGRILEYVR